MVALKVRRVGNSLGVVLPKEVLGHLRANEGEELYLLEGPNNSYRLTSLDPTFQKKMEQARTSWGAIATRCTFWRNERADLDRHRIGAGDP
jgi:putative addiction module antidote